MKDRQRIVLSGFARGVSVSSASYVAQLQAIESQMLHLYTPNGITTT